jgi:hypothetical protein
LIFSSRALSNAAALRLSEVLRFVATAILLYLF